MPVIKHESKYKGQAVTIQAGWDNPTQRYFMVVFVDTDSGIAEADDAGNVYSNLSDPLVPKDYGLQLRYFATKLRELDIQVPSGFFEKVEAAND